LPFELEIARLIKFWSVGSLILKKPVLLSELYSTLFHTVEIYNKYFLNIQIIFELKFRVIKIFE